MIFDLCALLVLMGVALAALVTANIFAALRKRRWEHRHKRAEGRLLVAEAERIVADNHLWYGLMALIAEIRDGPKN